MGRTLLVALMLLLTHTAMAGTVYVERVGPGEMRLEIRFEQSLFTFHRSGGYDYVEAQDMVFLPEEGIPALPYKTVHLAIPQDQRVDRIRATRSEVTIIEGSCRIAPTQPPAVLGSVPACWVDGRPEIYTSDSFYPTDPVGNTAEGYMGESKILSLAVCPFLWNPEGGTLKLATKINIRINLTPDPCRRGIRRWGGDHPRLLKAVRSLVANPSDMEEILSPPPTSPQGVISQVEEGSYEYVLITADSLASCFEPLLEWKRQKGVASKCVTREWIEANYSGSDSQDQIRNFIKDAYADWGTFWVVLAGDTAVVPCRYCFAMKISRGPTVDLIPCDLYFADLDGTWNADGDARYGEVADSVDMYPDLVVGRAPVENAAEAQIFVTKVLTYEKTPPPDYVLDILMAGEVMWNDPYTDSGIGLNLIDADCIPPRFDPILKLYESLGNESRETVLAAMSQGPHLVFHDGHGSGHALYVGPLGGDVVENEDADTLSNAPRNFILNSIACVPAAIDHSVIAEHLVNSPGGGCVAFIGNSHVGWGCPGHSGLGYSDRFQYEFAWQVFVEGTVNLGLAHNLSKVPFVPYAGDKNVYRFCEYELLLLGDPEMPVWTDTPLAFDIDYPDSIMAAGDDVTIVVSDTNGTIEGARVCLLNDDDLYLFGDTDASGMAAFSIAPASADSILLTVTGRNHLPFQTRIGVSSVGKRLVWCSYEVVDQNDGKPNPGETVGLRLCTKNQGDEMAYGVCTVVRPKDNSCAVTDSTAGFGDLIPGATAWSADTLVIEFAATLANADVAALQVDLTDDSPQTWSSTLPLLVATPLVGVASHGIQEVAGDGDGIVEPGEHILLTLEILNSGLTGATGVEAFVSTADPYLSVFDSTSLAGDVEAQACGLSLHTAQVSPMCPEPYIALIEADLWVSGTYSSTDTVYLCIGELAFSEDCDSGEGGWTHTGSPDLWHLSSYRSHSGSNSWYFGGETSRRYPNDADGVLTSETMLAGEASSLSFWVWYEVSTYGVDGVFVVLFRNGVPDTLDFIGSGGALTTGPWDTLITVSDWVEWEHSLDAVLPGDTLQLAFNFTSDGDTVAEGIYIDDISVTLREPVLTGLPDETGLAAGPEVMISPNPARETVSFMMARREAALAIDIYDIRGRLITRVVKPPGEVSATWDLRNASGSKVSPGIYLGRISGTPKGSVEKVVILH
jgi:hypothetical protein